uniref:Mannose-specific lectin 1 n=1 Tax=Anthurium amnicola TaxID=1678845 RepID=A0A1D1Z0U7_9ARAE
MAAPNPITSPIVRLPIFFIALTLVHPLTAADAPNNLLFSGETLVAGRRLAHGNHSFVMGGDCNLALDGSLWRSGTAGRGSGCRLTLEDDGRLVVRSEDGGTVWASHSGSSPRGDYVAVLETRGRVAVYGPAVWSGPELGGHRFRHGLGCLQKGGKWDNCIVGDASTAGSVIFSGQLLLDGSSRTTTGVWFLSLDHRGGLAVADGHHRVLWSNNVRSERGEYAAVFRRDGMVAVYGPVIWSTSAGAPAHHHVRVASEFRSEALRLETGG